MRNLFPKYTYTLSPCLSHSLPHKQFNSLSVSLPLPLHLSISHSLTHTHTNTPIHAHTNTRTYSRDAKIPRDTNASGQPNRKSDVFEWLAYPEADTMKFINNYNLKLFMFITIKTYLDLFITAKLA